MFIVVIFNKDHPNILKIYEYFDTPYKFYIVMDYCSGGQLMDRILERDEKNKPYTE